MSTPKMVPVTICLSAEYETHRSTINLLHQLSYGIEIVTQEAIGGRGAGLGRIEYSAGTDFTEPDYELLYYDISDRANGRNFSRSDFVPSSYSISDFGLSNGAHRALQTARHERLHHFFPGRRVGASRVETNMLNAQADNRHQTLVNLLAETMITAYGFSGEYLAYQPRRYQEATVQPYQVPDSYLALGQHAQATRLTDLTRLDEGGN